MRRLALVFGAVFVALMIWFSAPILIYGAVVPVLGPVLPRPTGVPKEAAASYEWKAHGMGWTWERTLPHGCARWFAANEYAWVSLTQSTDGCDGSGNSVSYLSFAEAITFDAHIPEPPTGEPCAFSKSPSDMADYRRIAAEGLAAATTSAERLVLQYVDNRLATFDGRPLKPEQHGGCSDLRPEERIRPAQHTDPWEAAK